MKLLAFLISTFLFVSLSFASSGYQVGDKAKDFRLKNVDGSYVSMSDFPDAKGFIVIFSCNHCPYVVAYEDRMIELHNEFADQGYPVIAINPNDPDVQPEDSFEKMQVRAREKNFPFPYLVDDKQEVYPQFGAERTPHVYLLNKDGNDLRVAYIGTIDDNYRDASKVEERYLANAIKAVMNGKSPEPAITRAIGCSIKSK
ncbi:MAG: thioredoxin family protein [Bacteroidales bacterium]